MRRRLREVGMERPKQRRRSDFVTEVEPTSAWTWGCCEPFCVDALHGPATPDRAFATEREAIDDLARHRIEDDKWRAQQTCTCRSCVIHGEPWHNMEVPR
jgi:hypothetical protein